MPILATVQRASPRGVAAALGRHRRAPGGRSALAAEPPAQRRDAVVDVVAGGLCVVVLALIRLDVVEQLGQGLGREGVRVNLLQRYDVVDITDLAGGIRVPTVVEEHGPAAELELEMEHAGQ